MLTHRGGAPEIRKTIAARRKRTRTPWASTTETSDPLSLMPQADGPGGLSTSDFAQVFQPPRANIGPPSRGTRVLGLPAPPPAPLQCSVRRCTRVRHPTSPYIL